MVISLLLVIIILLLLSPYLYFPLPFLCVILTLLSAFGRMHIR